MFGVKYLEAYDLIQVMLGAIVISMLGFTGVIAIDGGKTACFSRGGQTIASIGYIVLLFMFCHLFGAGGHHYFGGQCLMWVRSFRTLKAFFSAPFCFITQPGEKSDDEKIFPLEASERLFVAIEEDDAVDAQAALPPIIALSCTTEIIHDNYALCLKFWLDGVNRQELLRLIRKQAKGDELTTDERKV